MINRLIYSGALIVIGLGIVSLDILGIITGAVGWDRLAKGVLATIGFAIITLFLRRTTSKPPYQLMRDLNRLSRKHHNRLIYTEDTLMYIRRVPIPVIGMTIIGVIDKERFLDAMSDLNVGHRVTAVNADVFTIQGGGLITREMKGLEMTGTIDNPEFVAPTTRAGIAKMIVTIAVRSFTSIPFDMRTRMGKVTDDEVQHLAKQLADAEPAPLDDQE